MIAAIRSIRLVLVLTMFAAATGLATCQAADTFVVDPVHSSISFMTSHAGISYIHGAFNEYSGKFVIDKDDPAKSSFTLSIKVDSVDTNNVKRDEHLRGTRLFQRQAVPHARLQEHRGEEGRRGLRSNGDLTIHGITKSVTFVLKGATTGRVPQGRAADRRANQSEHQPQRVRHEGGAARSGRRSADEHLAGSGQRVEAFRQRQEGFVPAPSRSMRSRGARGSARRSAFFLSRIEANRGGSVATFVGYKSSRASLTHADYGLMVQALLVAAIGSGAAFILLGRWFRAAPPQRQRAAWVISLASGIYAGCGAARVAALAVPEDRHRFITIVLLWQLSQN